MRFMFILVFFSMIYSETVPTNLKDYAYDFPSIGYDISFPATSSYYSELKAGDSFKGENEGYKIIVRIENLSRNNRREFISYYNKNCKDDYSNDICPMIIEGEVELDESMSMILTAKKINFYNSARKTIIKSFD
mgnify:CR=1 FL=1